jgi:ribosome recycling factor
MLWEALRNLDTDVAYFIINSEPDDEELEYTEEQKEEVLEQYLDELDELIKNKYKELYNVDLVR